MILFYFHINLKINEHYIKKTIKKLEENKYIEHIQKYIINLKIKKSRKKRKIIKIQTLK